MILKQANEKMRKGIGLLLAGILVLSLAPEIEAGGKYKEGKEEVAPFSPEETRIRPLSPESASASDSVAVILLFPKLGTQNPTSDPNWYYYWKEGSVCGITASVHYETNPAFGFYVPGDDHIHVCDAAPTKNTGPETYTNDAGGSITVTGVGIGPQSVAETIAHEFLHKQIYDDWHALISAAEQDGQNDGDDYDDPDDDAIPNVKEDGFFGITTDKNDPDTYNMGGGYSGYGDNEIRCRKKELDPGITVDTSKDWADPGTNSDPPYNP